MTLYTFFHSNEPLIEAHFPLIFGYVVDHLESAPASSSFVENLFPRRSSLILENNQKSQAARSGL